MSGNYSIKDLERITGIKAHTLRIWEKRYGIVEPERTDTNIRWYDDEDLKRLLNVSILVRNGYKISRVADLNPEEINDKILEISRLSHNYCSQIESLIVSMLELDEDKFERLLNTSIIKMGFENTVFEIIYPLFEKIGVLWQTGSISPAQEHFISNLVRRKMFVAIDGLSQAKKPGAKTYLLFLPDWELHEIGLLLYDYLIRKQGHKVIFLGANTPLEDLIEIAKVQMPDYIFTSFISSVPQNELKTYIHDLAKTFSSLKIYISGIQTANISFTLPSNVSIIPSAQAFREKELISSN